MRMKPPLFKLLSALSLILGAFLLFSSQTGLTGAVIGNERVGSIGSIIGIILIIGGVLGVMVSEEGDLEREVKGPIKILISETALKRSKKDKRIMNDKKRYINEIIRISKNPRERPQEIIGEFKVSPKGNNPLRVAWDYEAEQNILEIYDFLYHINDKDYTDYWNKKAEKKEITKQTYKSNMEDFKGKL